MDHALFEGEAHRTFEDDDEDKSHAGRNVSEHLSDSYNLGTMVVAKDERADNTVKDLRRTLREIETIEHLQGEASGGVRATRMWYKDNMKRKVFTAFVTAGPVVIHFQLHPPQLLHTAGVPVDQGGSERFVPRRIRY